MYKHISFYKFVTIDNVSAEIARFKDICEKLKLKGTILLATEGINSGLAGSSEDIESFISLLKTDKRFQDIDFKVTQSSELPFRRMIVKQKQEIVTMGKPAIDPKTFTGHYLEAEELQKWMDAGKEIILVDTRNDYEVEIGTFENAINPDIQNFRTFPTWVESQLQNAKKAPVVTFCTGGIRCEKASAYMRQVGFEEVYQLHGGIIKYLEYTKQNQLHSHFKGDCFVFDGRVALNTELEEAPYTLCFGCRAALTEADKKHPLFIENKQCPRCAQTHAELRENREQRGKAKLAQSLEKRRQRAAELKKYFSTRVLSAQELVEHQGLQQ